MLNSANYWTSLTAQLVKKNANQNYSEVPLHLAEWSSLKSLQIINTGEGVEKRESSYTIGGNVSWYSHYGIQYGGSQKNKNRITI